MVDFLLAGRNVSPVCFSEKYGWMDSGWPWCRLCFHLARLPRNLAEARALLLPFSEVIGKCLSLGNDVQGSGCGCGYQWTQTHTHTNVIFMGSQPSKNSDLIWYHNMVFSVNFFGVHLFWAVSRWSCLIVFTCHSEWRHNRNYVYIHIYNK